MASKDPRRIPWAPPRRVPAFMAFPTARMRCNVRARPRDWTRLLAALPVILAFSSTSSARDAKVAARVASSKFAKAPGDRAVARTKRSAMPRRASAPVAWASTHARTMEHSSSVGWISFNRSRASPSRPELSSATATHNLSKSFRNRRRNFDRAIVAFCVRFLSRREIFFFFGRGADRVVRGPPPSLASLSLLSVLLFKLSSSPPPPLDDDDKDDKEDEEGSAGFEGATLAAKTSSRTAKSSSSSCCVPLSSFFQTLFSTAADLPIFSQWRAMVFFAVTTSPSGAPDTSSSSSSEAAAFGGSLFATRKRSTASGGTSSVSIFKRTFSTLTPNLTIFT
mmetsp:Transcript_9835/g.32021  ORF Transcript_9835/g.32021 Transcript_9835/m.32021 type:complete len:337 (-) Transcript_9835:285-1295(-)